MPSRYATRLCAVTKSAVKISVLDAADQLHQRVDPEPSPEPNAINVTISFESTWMTRGFYSKIGFAAAITGLRNLESNLHHLHGRETVLQTEILSRKCSNWTKEKQEDKAPEYDTWLERHKPNCKRNSTGSSHAMEPDAAERMWGSSAEKNLLVYLYL